MWSGAAGRVCRSVFFGRIHDVYFLIVLIGINEFRNY